MRRHAAGKIAEEFTELPGLPAAKKNSAEQLQSLTFCARREVRILAGEKNGGLEGVPVRPLLG
jgi:hypothetical protein